MLELVETHLFLKEETKDLCYMFFEFILMVTPMHLINGHQLFLTELAHFRWFVFSRLPVHLCFPAYIRHEVTPLLLTQLDLYFCSLVFVSWLYDLVSISKFLFC